MTKTSPRYGIKYPAPYARNQHLSIGQIIETIEAFGATFNPLRFGAVGDGVTDDTAALQACLDAAGAVCEIHIPTGYTFLVSPASESGFILKFGAGFTNVRIVGGGTIKVADDAGNYRGIIGFTNCPDVLQVVSVVFDHNGGTNTLANVTAYEAQLRSTVSTYGVTGSFDHVEIRNCEIRNADSTVSMYFSHATGNGHVDISHNEFRGCRNGNGADFDQSFINATCGSMTVVGNRMSGASWALAPRTAIETHAPDQVVMGNTVSYFQIFGNATGIHQSLGTTPRIIWQGNIANVSRDGLLLWSQSISPSNATLGVDGVLIADNLISMNPDQRVADASAGYRAIAFYGGANHIAANNVTIRGNRITYSDDDGEDSVVDHGTTNWGAVSWYLNSAPSIAHENIVIEHNEFTNCPSSAIFGDHGLWSGLVIRGNRIHDACVHQGTGALSNKVPVYLAIDLTSDAEITDNVIGWSVSTVPATDLYFVRDRASSPAYTFQIDHRNTYWPDGATITALGDYVGVYSGALVTFHGVVPTNDIRLPAMTGGQGSTVIVQDLNGKAVKTDSGATAWTRIFWAASAPASGTWRQSDRVLYTTVSAGGKLGAICTTAGTPGTWKPYGAIDA